MKNSACMKNQRPIVEILIFYMFNWAYLETFYDALTKTGAVKSDRFWTDFIPTDNTCQAQQI